MVKGLNWSERAFVNGPLMVLKCKYDQVRRTQSKCVTFRKARFHLCRVPTLSRFRLRQGHLMGIRNLNLKVLGQACVPAPLASYQHNTADNLRMGRKGAERTRPLAQVSLTEYAGCLRAVQVAMLVLLSSATQIGVS